MASDTAKRGKTFLVAYSSANQAIDAIVLTTEEYYEGCHEIIDSNEFRKQRGILRLTGEIYLSDGTLSQRFENHYDSNGKYIRGRAEHADGTIINH